MIKLFKIRESYSYKYFFTHKLLKCVLVGLKCNFYFFKNS